MFRNRLNGKYLLWYMNSIHKNRIDHVGKALLNRSYSTAVIQNHLLEWIRFSKYLVAKNIPVSTNIFSKEVKKYLKKRFPKGSPSRYRTIRAPIRIFLETDDFGNFTRRMIIPKPTPSFLYQQWVPQHLAYLRQHRNLAETTLRKRKLLLKKFTAFLKKAGIHCTKELSQQTIIDSFTNLNGWGQAMRLSYASALRGLLKWGYSEGIFFTDLSYAVITERKYRDAKIPNHLSSEELEKILSTVDRTTPLGKRNYAILLLAIRYGLRPCDIRQLSLDDIKWRKGIISITQAKTGKSLILPLVKDISGAIIEYLQYGRPSTNSRKVFVGHIAPYEPFSRNNNFSNIMRGILVQTGMNNREGLKGFYLFRHSLATRLLKRGTSVKTIADIMGHADISSTSIYTKVDLDMLRSVAISIKEVLSWNI